jgi:hypothetical protein
MATFYELFKKNMDLLGFPAPTSLFETAKTATESIAAITVASKTVGVGATIGEIGLTGALGITSGILVSAYIGVCIGSFAVAIFPSLVEPPTYDSFFRAATKLDIQKYNDHLDLYRIYLKYDHQINKSMMFNKVKHF